MSSEKKSNIDLSLSNESERNVVRELAKRYAEAAALPIQAERRDLWRRHNSLKASRPLIYTRAFAWSEMPESRCVCRDPLMLALESNLRLQLFWISLQDDSIFEPWITIPAVHRFSGWGVTSQCHKTDDPGGSYKVDYPIKNPEDIEKLRMPRYEIDEEATAQAVARAREVLGDILTVNLDRAPAYQMWQNDISTALGHLRGIENIMLDMVDRPEWLHRLLAFMRDGILRAREQAEQAGDCGLTSHQNQAMPYAEELADPAANVNGVRRAQLWGYMAAQEYTLISPAMHDEFLLQYQLPIMRPFGLTAYGCCEDLTNKIDMLRRIPNLRRIAVSPFANVARCAEQIGKDYVVSYRPSPADMVSYSFNEDRIRGILRRDLTACRNCHVDITLKDVETVERDPDRVRRWVSIARETIEEVFG